jgi:hypothetical protein
MKKSIVTLAALIALTPELGFPEAWKNAFVVIGGILIIVLVLVPRKEKIVRIKKKEENSFVENNPADKEQTQHTNEETLS